MVAPCIPQNDKLNIFSNKNKKNLNFSHTLRKNVSSIMQRVRLPKIALFLRTYVHHTGKGLYESPFACKVAFWICCVFLLKWNCIDSGGDIICTLWFLLSAETNFLNVFSQITMHGKSYVVLVAIFRSNSR